jgi:hypothetical protein
VALPAIGLYGATGAWADKPVAPGNSASAPGHSDDAAAAPAAVSAAAPGNSDHANQAGGPGNVDRGKKADDAPAVAVASVAVAPAAVVATPGNSDHSNGNASTVGSPKSPQPLSNADKNPGGANGNCGDYCSTRNGSPSLNGNGGGKSVGKPCAGCVGKADNKNPPGQYKNGSDHNAGYECDRNHGIGRSNPAHTGCTTTPPVCVPTTANNMCHPPCVATAANNFCQPPCVASAANNFCQPPCTSNCGGTTTGGGTGGTTGITTGGTTGAQTSGGTTGITTGGGSGAETTGGTTCPTSAQGLVGPMPAGCHLGGDSGGGGALPFTGLDAMVLVAVGAIAAGLGLALTAAGSMRRRPQA